MYFLFFQNLCLTSGNVAEFLYNPPSSFDIAPRHQTVVKVPTWILKKLKNLRHTYICPEKI